MDQCLTEDEALRLARDPTSAADLRTYFTRYEGRFFESFGGGGIVAPDALSAEDLVAVQLLSVSIPPAAVVALTYGQLGEDFAEKLAHIPVDVDLGSPEARDALSRDEAAWQAWTLLAGSKLGLGPTITSKLLARKRPRLIPVWDGVVHCALGRPPTGESWELMHNLFTSELPSLLRRVAIDARLPTQIEPPRVFDVIVWMRHKAQHRTLRGRCPSRLQVRAG